MTRLWGEAVAMAAERLEDFDCQRKGREPRLCAVAMAAERLEDFDQVSPRSAVGRWGRSNGSGAP